MKKSIILAVGIFISIMSYSQSASELTEKGKKLYEQREYMQAVINYNKAIDVDPNYSQAYYMRGKIKEAFEDIHGAMKDFNTAIDKNSKYAEAFFARGNIKYKLQDYYGAIADYSSTIQLDANNIKYLNDIPICFKYVKL